MERQIAEGNKVSARWTMTGTHEGTFLGIPPTHKSIQDQGVDLFVFHRGRIADIFFVNENAIPS